MGFFSTLFSGKDTTAHDSSVQQNAISREDFKAGQAQGRADVQNLFPAAQTDLSNAFQSAGALIGNIAPARLEATQFGTMDAQNILRSGLGQQRNALMGLPTDFSGLTVQANPVNPQRVQDILSQHQPVEATPFNFDAANPVVPVVEPVNSGNTIDGLTDDQLTRLKKQLDYQDMLEKSAPYQGGSV